MLARLAEGLPGSGGFLYEPKWDGFRAIVFRGGDDVFIQSRDLRPLDRYFPELHAALLAALPDGCVVDGEIVIATEHGLDFDALQQRIHPAESRVQKLAAETPTSFVAFDLLAEGDDDLRAAPFSERRARLERSLAKAKPPVHLTPASTDPAVAERWFGEFEGAGLDGVIAKPLGLEYQPDKRVMFKVKHLRTADCAVAGFRVHKDGKGVGSLLLGLYDDGGTLQNVGVASSFAAPMRKQLADELEPYRANALEGHPWQEWADAQAQAAGETRMPGGLSRWNAKKDLSWEPVRVELVAEVAYEHMQGDRFRHTARFQRWRPEREPASCTYDQLESVVPAALRELFLPL
jgi:ATP-dependent DNA ligase